MKGTHEFDKYRNYKNFLFAINILVSDPSTLCDFHINS